MAVTRLLREAVGNDVELYMDMNWSRTVDSAIALGRELAPFDLSWIEDPLPANDYDGLRQISEARKPQSAPARPSIRRWSSEACSIAAASMSS